MNVIVDLAASANAAVRVLALKYLIDNIPKRYDDYDPANFQDIAYVPALRGDNSVQGTPKEARHSTVFLFHVFITCSQVFADPNWGSFGFLVVQPNYRADALVKLKISTQPPASLLVSLLRKLPPKDVSQARQWFTLLAGRISGLFRAILI